MCIYCVDLVPVFTKDCTEMNIIAADSQSIIVISNHAITQIWNAEWMPKLVFPNKWLKPCHGYMANLKGVCPLRARPLILNVKLL